MRRRRPDAPPGAREAERRYLESLRRRVSWQAAAAAARRAAAAAPARLSHEEGQATVLLALGLLVVLLGIAAAVVDGGRLYAVRQRLQAAADASALAAAAALPSVSQAEAAAAAYGSAGKNRIASAGGVVAGETVTAACLRGVSYCFGNVPGGSPANGRANGVSVEETAAVPTSFMRLFGIPTVTLHARATACGMCGARPLDIALVVDRTGSMSDNLADLRAGIDAFLSSLDPQLDDVSLLVLPPAPDGDPCVPAADGVEPFHDSAYPTSSDDAYAVVHFSHDYQLPDGALDPDSTLVRDVGCIAASGATSYRQALVAAAQELANAPAGRENVQKVIVFETDGAANTAIDSAYDPSRSYRGYYTPTAAGADQVLRPCGSALDYAKNVVEPAGTLLFTVAYQTERDDDCFEAPHAEPRGRRWGWWWTVVGYRQVRERLGATETLAEMANPGDAFAAEDASGLSGAFATIAAAIRGATLVPDAEAGF